MTFSAQNENLFDSKNSSFFSSDITKEENHFPGEKLFKSKSENKFDFDCSLISTSSQKNKIPQDLFNIKTMIKQSIEGLSTILSSKTTNNVFLKSEKIQARMFKFDPIDERDEDIVRRGSNDKLGLKVRKVVEKPKQIKSNFNLIKKEIGKSQTINNYKLRNDPKMKKNGFSSSSFNNILRNFDIRSQKASKEDINSMVGCIDSSRVNIRKFINKNIVNDRVKSLDRNQLKTSRFNLVKIKKPTHTIKNFQNNYINNKIKNNLKTKNKINNFNSISNSTMNSLYKTDKTINKYKTEISNNIKGIRKNSDNLSISKQKSTLYSKYKMSDLKEQYSSRSNKQNYGEKLNNFDLSLFQSDQKILNEIIEKLSQISVFLGNTILKSPKIDQKINPMKNDDLSSRSNSLIEIPKSFSGAGHDFNKRKGLDLEKIIKIQTYWRNYKFKKITKNEKNFGFYSKNVLKKLLKQQLHKNLNESITLIQIGQSMNQSMKLWNDLFKPRSDNDYLKDSIISLSSPRIEENNFNAISKFITAKLKILQKDFETVPKSQEKNFF